MRKPIKVYILDDHDDVRQALFASLCSVPGLLVVGETSEAEAGLMEIAALRPDVVLVETKRADGRGLEIVNYLIRSSSGVSVIVLTSYPSEWEKWAAYRAGAARYLLKDVGLTQLIHEIETAVPSRARV